MPTTTMQSKLLDAFTDRIESAGFEPVVNPAWANTGTLYAMYGLDVRLVVGYGFQGGYCSIDLHGPAVDATEPVDSPPLWRVETVGGEQWIRFHHLDYVDGSRLTHLVAMIGELLGLADA